MRTSRLLNTRTIAGTTLATLAFLTVAPAIAQAEELTADSATTQVVDDSAAQAQATADAEAAAAAELAAQQAAEAEAQAQQAAADAAAAQQRAAEEAAQQAQEAAAQAAADAEAQAAQQASEPVTQTVPATNPQTAPADNVDETVGQPDDTEQSPSNGDTDDTSNQDDAGDTSTDDETVVSDPDPSTVLPPVAPVTGQERLDASSYSCESSEVIEFSLLGSGYEGVVNGIISQNGNTVATASTSANADGSVNLVVAVSGEALSNARFGNVDITLADGDGGDGQTGIRYNCRDSEDTNTKVSSVTASCTAGLASSVTITGTGAQRNLAFTATATDDNGNSLSEEPAQGQVDENGNFSVTIQFDAGKLTASGSFRLGYSPVEGFIAGSFGCTVLPDPGDNGGENPNPGDGGNNGGETPGNPSDGGNTPEHPGTTPAPVPGNVNPWVPNQPVHETPVANEPPLVTVVRHAVPSSAPVQASSPSLAYTNGSSLDPRDGVVLATLAIVAGVGLVGASRIGRHRAQD